MKRLKIGIVVVLYFMMFCSIYAVLTYPVANQVTVYRICHLDNGLIGVNKTTETLDSTWHVTEINSIKTIYNSYDASQAIEYVLNNSLLFYTFEVGHYLIYSTIKIPINCRNLTASNNVVLDIAGNFSGNSIYKIHSGSEFFLNIHTDERIYQEAHSHQIIPIFEFYN